MDGLINHTISYVHDTLDVDLKPDRWKEENNLAFYLRNRYRYYQIKIMHTPILLMLDVGEDENTPANIRKQIKSVQDKWEHSIIYVRDRLTTYNRKRLIAQKVPFIIPGNQMYLPMLGIDLREHFKKIRTETPVLSPAAQVVLIAFILGKQTDPLTPKVLAGRFGYSAMTMTRVFDEIEASGLGFFEKQGRQRNLKFTENPKELWEKVLPLLRSPVRQKKHVTGINGIEKSAPSAGFAALACFSMLDEPPVPVFAVSGASWRALQKKEQVQVVTPSDSDGINIEVWAYDPNLFAADGIVDPLSLYLSLQDEKDERVEAALEDMLKGISW